MTEPPTPAEPGPVDADVELASAHLDGEAGADERSRAEEPAVRAHRAAFAEVAEAVRDVPPPPTGALDDHVGRAMAAFDEEARVVPLGGSRATPWWQRIPLGAVAAGLVVVALLGAIGLASTIETDSDDSATAELESADDRAGPADESAADGEASTGVPEGSAAPEVSSQLEAAGERTAYDSYDALAEDVRAALGSTPDEAGPGGAEADVATTQGDRTDGEDAEALADPCGAASLLGLDPGDVVLVRSAVVDADEVTVVVHDADDGRRLVVVEDRTCDVVVDRLL